MASRIQLALIVDSTKEKPSIFLGCPDGVSSTTTATVDPIRPWTGEFTMIFRNKLDEEAKILLDQTLALSGNLAGADANARWVHKKYVTIREKEGLSNYCDLAEPNTSRIWSCRDD